jgi:hypothetical protein
MKQFLTVFVAVLTASALALSISNATAGNAVSTHQLQKINANLWKISQQLGNCFEEGPNERKARYTICAEIKQLDSDVRATK